MKPPHLIPALFGLAAIAFAATPGAAQPAPVKLQYTGYLVDSPVLDARVEVARDAEIGLGQNATRQDRRKRVCRMDPTTAPLLGKSTFV